MPHDPTHGAHDLARARPALTPREHEIAALVAQGLTNDQIGVCLGISPRTVQSHVAASMGKTQAANRTQLAVIASVRGWIDVGWARG